MQDDAAVLMDKIFTAVQLNYSSLSALPFSTI
jgi:hypothetical protein